MNTLARVPHVPARAVLCVLILLPAAAGSRPSKAEDASSADNAYLDGLKGNWDMTGTLLGKPVKYRARIPTPAYARHRRRRARVVATGTRNGETLVIQFPYAEGAFRNTFTFDPKSGGWTLNIDSRAAGGAWSNFATYTLKRPGI
jgi:hypothetical protein